MQIDEITTILNDAKTAIEQNIDNSGVTSSGKSRNSLRVEIQGNNVVLGSTFDFFEVLENGRKPGKFPQKDVIYQWTIDKGFQFSKDYQRKGFAYVVSRNIARGGYGRPTPPHKDFGNTVSNIYSDVVKATVERLKPAILKTIALSIKNY